MALVGYLTTAQKLTASSTTDAFKACKHALQEKKVHPGKVELNRREREAMSQQQQPMAASAEAVWGDAARGAGLEDSVTCERTAAVSAAPSATVAAAAAAFARARPATVEPDSHHREERRHTPAVAVTTAAAAAAAAPSTRGGAVAASALLPYDGRGSAVPVSPPSSPTHVTAQQQATVGPSAAAGARAATVAGAGAATAGAGRGGVVAFEEAPRVHQSHSGGGEPATPAADVNMPPAVLPPPALSVTPTPTEAAARAELGVCSGEAVVVTAGAGAGSAPAALSPSQLLPAESPPVPAVPAPVPQLRLGRGRKLCPNCNALTKSAVKQCRECQHFFSPASSRLRPPPREPKENEEAPMPPRRRLRPSQRLIEYELSEASPAALAREAADGGGGGGRSLSASARRPLAATTAAGGGANQRVASGGGGGRPAAADGAAGKKPLPLGGGNGGGGAVQPPKRSHKRKIPLPPGVAPPKRKKGAAAAARALASAAPNAGGGAAGAHRMLPSLSLPERQRVAEDLLASSAPATGHTLVPRSPELTPTAAPTGPLLFMSSAASLEDDSEWLSPPPAATSRCSGSVPGVSGGGGSTVPVCGAGAGAGADAVTAGSLPLSVATPFSLAPTPLEALSVREFCSAHADGVVEHGVGQGVAPVPGMYAHEIAVSAADCLLEKGPSSPPRLLLPPRRQEDVIDLSAESQDRDPFEGVELWLEDGDDGGGGGGGERGGGEEGVEVPSSVNAVFFGVPTTFPEVGVGEGRDGTMEQRVLALDESMDLLGDDTDDNTMWSPLRGTNGANDCSSEASGDGLSLWAEEEGNGGGGGGDGGGGSGAALTSPRHCFPSSTANVIYSTVERGAARASAPGLTGSGTDSDGGGGWGGGNSDATAEAGLGAGAGEGRGAASAANILGGKPVGFSSLEPLPLTNGGVSGDGSEGVVGVAAAVAAVSLDSGDGSGSGSGGDSGCGGGGGGEGRPWGVTPSREAATPLATTGGFYPRPVTS